MALTGSVSGLITVGGAGQVEERIAIAASTGTITDKIRGKKVIDKNSSFVVPFGGMTGAKMIWWKARDNAVTATNRYIVVSLGATVGSTTTVSTVTATEGVLIASEGGAIDAITFATQANFTTLVDYIVAA
jgi:hypothetical protein